MYKTPTHTHFILSGDRRIMDPDVGTVLGEQWFDRDEFRALIEGPPSIYPTGYMDWIDEHASSARFWVFESRKVGLRGEILIADENEAFAYRMRWPEPLS